VIELRRTAEYDAWIRGLRDINARARINARVKRMLQGNPGQYRSLKGGVVEMKIDYGPGYQVYYTQRGNVLVILLCGGTKDRQQADINLATALATNL
jgi:putative addiction module killer protein